VKQNNKILFMNTCLRKGADLKILPVGLASVMTYVKMNSELSFDLLDIDIHEYTDDEILTQIHTNKYDIILFGSIVTHYKWAKEICKKIKEQNSSITLIVGNSVGASCPDTFMTHAPADIIVAGEGEITCLEVLQALENKTDLSTIEGIIYRGTDSTLVTTPRRKACDINSLPMVDWSFFDVEKYKIKSKKTSFGTTDNEEQVITMPVSTARGCAFHCTFCHHVFWKDPYRVRSAENVLAEIKRNIEMYDANFINFWDDLSFATVPQTEKMVDAILDSGLQFKWMAAIRTDLLGNPKIPFQRRRQLAQRLKQAGCVSLGFSLESGDPDILKMMDKRIDVSYFSEQVHLLQEVGIVCNTSVVFGYPLENEETIRKTFDQCYQCKVYPSIGFLLPLPETKMYQWARDHGFITDEDKYLTDITERQDFCLNMTQLPEEEIKRHITEGAKRLNKLLELNLDDDSYIKTGGYKKHTNNEAQKDKRGLDVENMKRKENDFSFNYSEEVYKA
jgi:radical SAM superfamily enzyme YgiQ (UPF0313 family)